TRLTPFPNPPLSGSAEHEKNEKPRNRNDRPQPDQRAVPAPEHPGDDRIIRFRLARLVGCGPLPPVEQRERTRLRPGSGIRFGSGGGDTGILICQLPAYLDETAVELGDFAAAGGAELFLGELDALVDRVRRNPELAADLLGGLVLYQEVEHLALLGRQPRQYEFDLGVLAHHVAPAFSISLPPPRRSRLGPSRI